MSKDKPAANRDIRWDVAGILTGAIAIFVLIALVSYDPADSLGTLIVPLRWFYTPDALVFPENANIQNWCGYWGALTSRVLLDAFGIGAFVVSLLLFLSVAVMLRQRPLASPLARSLGWTMILLSITTLASLCNVSAASAPPIGAGGHLGALTSTWIHRHFAFGGGIILAVSIGVAGLLLSTEYAVVYLVQRLLASVGPILVRGRDNWKMPAAGNLQRNAKDSKAKPVPTGETGLLTRADLEPKEPYSEPPIRVRGRGNIGTTDKRSVPLSAEASSHDQSPKAAISQDDDPKDVPVKNLGKAKPEAASSPIEEKEVETEEEPIVRELDINGETVVARADGSHSVPEPRIRNRASKKKHNAQLEPMDDTKLPDGTQEYVLPSLNLLDEGEAFAYEEQATEVRRKAKILEQTFQDFGFNIRVVEIETGPVIAQYEIELEAGLRLSKITSLSDDLAIALRVPSVRIVAPIPGKNTVGIEVPNESRQIVHMREVIEEADTATRKMKIPLFLGKDVSGNPLSVDLASLPHLLIAGRTGTGKSVCLNSIICSILMTRRPDEVRLLMIDPKMVELSGYARLPHLMHPVVTDMRKAEAILAWAVDKMEERYALLARVGVRHLVNYNQLGREELIERLAPESPEEAELIPDHLPFIVIVADEIADLMMTSGKEVEQHIIRLAQKSRAVGIHLILATQKPTVDVITGLIKSNLPARISFQVASRTDSRVVLDEMGADKLLGNGDMLFLWPGTSMLLRGQGTYLSDDEINRVVAHCSTGEQHFVNELVNLKVRDNAEGDEAKPIAMKKRDELYEAAVEIVIREGRGSCSLLQRAMGIGYGRAARLIDFMAEDGIVGQYNGSQARDVIITMADWERLRGGSSAEGAATAPANRKKRISRNAGWDDEETDTGSIPFIPNFEATDGHSPSNV